MKALINNDKKKVIDNVDFVSERKVTDDDKSKPAYYVMQLSISNNASSALQEIESVLTNIKTISLYNDLDEVVQEYNQYTTVVTVERTMRNDRNLINVIIK